MRLLNLDLKRSLSLGCCSVFDGEGEGIVDVENCEAGEGQMKAAADEAAGNAARASRRTRVSRVLAVLALQLAHAQLHAVRSSTPFVAPERFCASRLSAGGGT